MNACLKQRGRLFAVMIATGWLGCDAPPSRVVAVAPASESGAQAIALHDANKDGLLDATELEKTPGLRAALKQVDKNHDGKVSAEEITARLKMWADSKIGRLSVACRVMRNGKPLVGAKVSLVPEKFLGPALPTATGVSDAQGSVAPSLPLDNDQPPGVAPGFYRVEITHPSESIPANNNVETIHGLEVASDVEALLFGNLVFELR